MAGVYTVKQVNSYIKNSETGDFYKTAAESY